MSNLVLQRMYEAINSLDPNNQFKGISYNLTTRNTLSSDTGIPWWCFIPYGNWANAGNNTLPVPSPFQSYIKNQVDAGFKDASATVYYIDLLQLGGESDAQFFNDPLDKESIVDQLARLINPIPENVSIHIRYLEGGQPHAESAPAQNSVVKAFFPDNSPFKRPNVYFYYGGYNPDLAPSETAAFKALITRFINWLLNSLSQSDPTLYKILKALEPGLVALIMEFFSSTDITQGSWNHAKIVAINGRWLVTGGANFWNEYQAGSDKPFDMAMSVEGDAAADAHAFANYLWSYLALIPPTDTKSWCMVNTLGNPITGFKNTTNPVVFPFSTQNTGTSNVLSAGRNGHFTAQRLGYPQQLVDALRDITVNLIGAVFEKTHPALVVWTAYNLRDDNEAMQVFFRSEGINTTAWASRFARNYAITNASSSLKISQQKFVQDDVLSASSYQAFMAFVNEIFGVNWDGIIWPYDLLVSLGFALSAMSQQYQSGPRVQLVSSFYGNNHSGYADPVTAAAFSEKLYGVMNAMQYLKYISPKGFILDIIRNLLSYKRVPQLPGEEVGNHCKLLMADDAVCYIGSDNAYPSYNEEFGLWIDDEDAIQQFITNYWSVLWQKAANG